jgi:hypothetical protein
MATPNQTGAVVTPETCKACGWVRGVGVDRCERDFWSMAAYAAVEAERTCYRRGYERACRERDDARAEVERLRGLLPAETLEEFARRVAPRRFTAEERLRPCVECGIPDAKNGQHDYAHPFRPAPTEEP